MPMTLDKAFKEADRDFKEAVWAFKEVRRGERGREGDWRGRRRNKVMSTKYCIFGPL